MKTAIERFLKYVSFDTESDEASVSCPSTAKQRVLAEQLRQELIELGAADVRVSEFGYVFARIPSTIGTASANAGDGGRGAAPENRWHRIYIRRRTGIGAWRCVLSGRKAERASPDRTRDV